MPLVGWFILLLVAPFALLKSWASEPEPEFSQSFRSAAYQDYVAALVATPREDYLATKETP